MESVPTTKMFGLFLFPDPCSVIHNTADFITSSNALIQVAKSLTMALKTAVTC